MTGALVFTAVRLRLVGNGLDRSEKTNLLLVGGTLKSVPYRSLSNVFFQFRKAEGCLRAQRR